MDTSLPLIHTASIFPSNLPSERQSYKKHAEWELRSTRANITQEFQISRVAEGTFASQRRKNKKDCMFSSYGSDRLGKACLATALHFLLIKPCLFPVVWAAGRRKNKQAIAKSTANLHNKRQNFF